MRILVTGASSLIGRHVVELLLKRGDTVTVMQRKPAAIDGVREVLFDLAAEPYTHDLQNVKEPLVSNDDAIDVADELVTAMTDQDAVIHLAAKVGVAGRFEAYAAININGTRQMIKAALHCKVSRFVHISSPSVSHAGKSLIGAPAGSADPDNVRGHYARTKALGEQIALAANCEELQVLSLRPHLVWGPGDTQLVQRIIDRARAGRLQLVGSGQAFIDTTYIDNAAAAIVAGVDNIQRAAGHALVISNGQPRTVNEIIRRMLQAGGVTTSLRHVPVPVALAAGSLIEKVWDAMNKQTDPPMTRFLAEQLATAHWFDQRKTRQLLDWAPVIGIEEGFELLAKSMAERE